ncbi:MAG TPA: hypothetical protein VM326_03955 [Sphingomicrobium sp.]|jgi:hypothetical protein|nr:hypothetical protein [Sphingomicrobium sp.]
MDDTKKDGGDFDTRNPNAEPQQGGSNLGGEGATSATDLLRDPEAEGFARPEAPASSAREQAIVDQAEARKREPAKDES